jgi:gluconate 5-dehydrogenase
MTAHPGFDIEGRIALVTGSSRGIGYALATGLAEARAVVSLNGRDADALERSRNEIIDATGGVVHARAFDATSSQQVASPVDIESEIGPVDIVVNNTGVQHRSPLLDFADEEFRRILDTNLVSAFYVGREFARAMIGRGRGKIIKICSVQSKLGRAGIAPYAASKGGLKMLTRGMCAEWAHLGLQINALAPGYFDTKLTEALVNDGEFPARLGMRTPQADGAPRGTRRRAAVPLLRGVKLRQWPDPLRGRRPDRRRLTARIDNHSPPDRKRAMSNLHPQVHLGPTRDSFLSRGIERGGGVLVPLADADAVVWTRGPDTFPDSLPERVRWVQLPSAGVEPWLSADIVDDTRIWTSAAGAYAQNVAEHAVLLLLAGVRALGPQVRATSWRKTEFDSQVGRDRRDRRLWRHRSCNNTHPDRIRRQDTGCHPVRYPGRWRSRNGRCRPDPPNLVAIRPFRDRSARHVEHRIDGGRARARPDETDRMDRQYRPRRACRHQCPGARTTGRFHRGRRP